MCAGENPDESAAADGMPIVPDCGLHGRGCSGCGIDQLASSDRFSLATALVPRVDSSNQATLDRTSETVSPTGLALQPAPKRALDLFVVNDQGARLTPTQKRDDDRALLPVTP